MRTRLLLLTLLVLAPLARATGNLDPALLERHWLRSVLVYSYYWYLEDRFFVDLGEHDSLELWLRQVEPASRDEDDHSRYAELWLPASGIRLSLKKADYPIPELQLRAQAPHYRVVRGSYEPPGAPDPSEGWTQLSLPREEVEQALRAARGDLHAPVPERKDFIIAALRREIALAGGDGETQTLYVAARTDVSTAIWAYWLERRILFQFSGDIDAVSPADLGKLPLLLKSYPLRENVVVSAQESLGHGAMLTRELASRALFLCLARGEALHLAATKR